MNPLLWIMSAIAGILIPAIVLIGYFRALNPHSRKMMEAQMHLNKKTGVPHETVATAKADAKTGKGSWGLRTKLSSNLWGILLLLAGAAIIYWGLYTPILESPHLSKVGGWSWDHWLPLVVLWGIIAILIGLYAEREETKKKLQNVLTAIMVMLFVGVSVMNWVASGLTSSHVSQGRFNQALPQDAVNLPWAWHLDPSKWPQVEVPAHGDSVHVPGVYGGHVVWGGSGFTVRCVYTNGHVGTVGDPSNPCTDGNIVESYAHNEGDTPLLASYAYARPDEK
ncbi:MAG: hypothetical protein ACYC1Y_00830 [Minisyncoccota bacterium]